MEGFGSNYGPKLDIMAPGVEILATDLLGSFGYTDDDYNDVVGEFFSGTSAAAPHVAGVAGLILSVNPYLTQKQVGDIIEQTAQKIGGYEYEIAPNRPNGTFHIEMGYGALDAGKAVALAKSTCTNEADLYSRDLPFDVGIEPFNENEVWLSEDIFIGTETDGNEIFKNPTYDEVNYIYVRVRNRGCKPTTGNEKLQLHWAKASTALNWPESWNGTLDLDPDPTVEALAGELISEKTIPIIEPNSSTLIRFEWYPPNPENYKRFNIDPQHFCLLSRIISNDDPIAEPTGSSDIGNYVRNNNNVAWRNYSVQGDFDLNLVWNGANCPADLLNGSGTSVSILNPNNFSDNFNINVTIPKKESNNPISSNAAILFSLNDQLYNKWLLGGRKGYGYNELKLNGINEIVNQVLGGTFSLGSIYPDESIENRNLFEITTDSASFENISLNANEHQTATIGVLFPADAVTSKEIFFVDITQTETNSNIKIGGTRIVVKKPDCSAKKITAGNDRSIGFTCSTELQASNQFDCTSYRWTDSFGNLISTEPNVDVSPLVSTEYTLTTTTLEACANTSKVSVNVEPGICNTPIYSGCVREINMHPNPTDGIINVDLTSDIQTQVTIIVYNAVFGNPLTTTVENIANGITSIPLDISNLPDGLLRIVVKCTSDNTEYIYQELITKY